MRRAKSHALFTPGYRIDEISFEPDADEIQALRNWKHAQNELARMLRKRALWEEQDRDHNAFVLAQRQKYAKALGARIASDKLADELRAARDAEILKVRSYYLNELEKEIAAADRKRKEALETITKRIQRDKLKVEREELTRRGVVRGRR